ncbi:Ataxin-3 [Dinochytrium kinnereticum]|nr:Ataxin-3 [Dinochytrium kinnereticum]
MDLVSLGLIFHEKQEGQLCAQHALNCLLQGPYFTAVDLSSLGRELDERELEMMQADESLQQNSDYKKYLKDGSYNFDDSGFFSVQVMEKALEVWNLKLSPITSSENAEAREDPASQKAFILNFEQHWFCIRRFGSSRKRWYNLDSTKNQPTHVSEMYLSLLLKQFESDGYSVFVVNGDIPICDGDVAADECPSPQPGNYAMNTSGSEDDLAKAIAMSMAGTVEGQKSGFMDEYDADLERAILDSLPGNAASSSSSAAQEPPKELSADDLRRKRLEMFAKK